jgi:CubicO group peptidase (beta-lactamase class C family)
MNRRLHNIIITLFLVLIAGCNRDGPLLTDVPIETISRELDAVAPPLMKKHNVVGLSLVVIREGKMSLSKSYGYADLASKRIVDEQTVFRAASLGKPIFAYIVVSLAQQRKFDLDEPLYTYLKEEVVKGDPRSKIITARMALSHRTGLPNLDGRKSDIKFIFDPGTDFQYSGHAYLYLQKVIEKITGKHLNDLANELVFKPLKMADSSFVWQDKYRDRISSSYDISGGVFRSKEKPEIGYSAWSLFTSPKDYARFVIHIIDSSKAQDSVAAVMMKSQVDVARNVKWGLGWGLQDTIPNYSFWHWGSMAGFRHYVVGYPDEKMAVIVMTNSWKAFKMVNDIMAKSIGGSYPSYDWF